MNPTDYESLDLAVNQGDGKRLLNERAAREPVRSTWHL